MKILKQEFDKLYSDDITKKEYDAIINKIDQRFSEIILALKPSLKDRGRFDYGNCSYDDSGPDGGYFDIKAFKDNINIDNEYAFLPIPFGCSIPTRWLWEDFLEDFENNVKAYGESKKEAAKHKERKTQLLESIKSKLTQEELSILNLK